MLNKVFFVEKMAFIDQYTIEHEPISSLELMERAAQVWTDFFLELLNHYQNIAVIAGHGNNGGDGYVVARLLKKKGKRVTVFSLSGNFTPDCAANRFRWLKEGGEIIDIISGKEVKIDPDAVIIDAILGSGLNRPVKGLKADLIRKINQLPNLVVSIDLPSGLMGEDNTHNCRETIVRADYTFTFQFPKLAFFLSENADYVGQWFVLDIGLNQEIMQQLATSWFYTTQTVVKELLPIPKKFAHKGTNGKGLLIAGKYGMMGAAVLAAKAALRSGIGLLCCHTPREGVDILQITVPESILCIESSNERQLEIEELEGFGAVAVGPVIGKSPETARGLQHLLQVWRGTTILDADALNLLAEHQDLLKLLHRRCILTPHLKEFERLAGKSENDFDRLNKLSNFAKQFQVHVILKGAHTIIATPEGELHFNMSGNPGMAKGGAGDVLTGVLLAFAANGLDPLDVARIGVYAHGLCGDLLQEEMGCRGISAGQLAEQLPKVWKILENKN